MSEPMKPASPPPLAGAAGSALEAALALLAAGTQHGRHNVSNQDTEAGPGGVSTRGLAEVLGMDPGRIQRILLYCAQCGRIARLRRGTPGHTGTSDVWAPASP